MRARSRRPSWLRPHGLIAVVAMMAAALALAGATRPAFAAASAPAVEVTGNHRTTVESITSMLQLPPGKRLDEAASDRAVRALMATGNFSDVRIDRRGNGVLVTVVENPTVNQVTYEGNKAVDTTKLKDVVQLKIRGIYSTARANADVERIRDLYKKQGRVATVITAKTAPLTENRVDVTFQVKEADVRKVLSISFNGARAFTPSQLRDAIATTESSWLDILRDSATYDTDRLELDQTLLRRYYQTHGYPDVRITAPPPQLDPEGKGYKIVFDIDEGDRFTLTSGRVEKVAEGTLPDLSSSLTGKDGEAFNTEHVDKTVEQMSSKLADAGHASMRVVPKLTRDTARHTIGVTYRIEEGPHVSVERIDITGNAYTKQHVIRRELKLVEGGPFNAVLLKRDKARLMRLGFFKSVEIIPRPGSGPDRLILEVAVVEQENRELSYGIGYSSVQGITGDVSFTENNFMGNGQTVRVKVAASEVGYSGELGFTEPHILDSPVAGGFDLFYRDTDSSAYSSFKSAKAGGDIRLGYAITDNLSAGTNYTFTRNQIYDVGPAASTVIKDAVPGYPATTASTYYTSSIGYSLTWDDRNAKKLPTSGSYFSLAQDFAGLGGDARFIRQVADGRVYYTVGDQVTLVGRAVAGDITGWGGQEVRLLDLFYRGGETVRGFAASGIGPRDTLSANQDALGGTHYIATTAEARAPIPFVPESAGLKAAVFADAGSLWGTTATAAATPGVTGASPTLRTSVGAGIVWDSPLGAFRVDYAVPLMKQAFDKTQPLSFGLAPY